MAATAPASSDSASSAALRRLHSDWKRLQKSNNPQIAVRPSDDNFLEWHFVLHQLPSDTPYHQGCYHGKIVFPPMYPNEPPSIIMITPSGRLETHKRLCLSMTDFHPESWNPAWSVETILIGLLSFFLTNEKGYGTVESADEQRRRLAKESWSRNAAAKDFKELFPAFAEAPQPDQAASRSEVEPPIEIQSPEENRTGPSSLDGGAEAAQEPMECWYCRDNSSPEPLIHPCACRGSMSGVHASCVEEWIRHHRRTARDAAPPRCSVCNQDYAGSERRPSVGDFVRDRCRSLASQLLRALVLVMILLGYQVVPAKQLHIPIIISVSVITVFAVVATHKLLILMASLPPNRLPPEHPLLHRFFISDPRVLALHIAEVFSAIMVLAFWTAIGALPIAYFLPPAGACLLLVAKLSLGNGPSLACLRRLCICVMGTLLSPILVLIGLLHFVRRHPRQAMDILIHPLGPGPHVAVAIAAGSVALACNSNLPLIVLLGVHALFLFAACLERLVVRRLDWKAGRFWWITLHVAVISCYLCNFCEFPAGIGNAEESAFIVFGSTLAWLGLVMTLTVSINWTQCVEAFRTWQNQHGVFTLQPSDDPLSSSPNEPLEP